MRKTLTILAFLAVLSARATFADDDCFVPMSQWQPRGAVEELAAANDWTVRRIKIDDGCYEIDGRDSADRRVEVKVLPGTLLIVDIEYEDEDGRDRPRRSGQRDN